MDGYYLLVDSSGNATEVSKKILIGRGKTSDLVIDDQLVSRHHATVWMEDDKLMLKDEESVNGTFVNDEQIYDTVVLQDGDLVKIGDEVLTVKAPLLEAKTVKRPIEEAAPEALEEEVGEEAPAPEEPAEAVETPEIVEDVVEFKEDKPANNPLKIVLIVVIALVVLCICVGAIGAGWFFLVRSSSVKLIESGVRLLPIWFG